MASFSENAFIVLREMNTVGAIRGYSISRDQIVARTGLDEELALQALMALVQRRLVETTMEYAAFNLSPGGLDYIAGELTTRLPLNLDAERVLRYVVEQTRPGTGIGHQIIISELGLNEDRYAAAFDLLVEFELIEDRYGDYKLAPLNKGRQAVRRNFIDRPMSSPSIQAGAIFYGNVQESSIQAVAEAVDSTIEQTISQVEPDELRQRIGELLENIVGEVAEQLDEGQRAAYLEAADHLRLQVSQPNPEPAAIHKLLGVVGFMDQANGTLDLGMKGLGLAALVAGKMALLYQLINHLISTMPQ